MSLLRAHQTTFTYLGPVPEHQEKKVELTVCVQLHFSFISASFHRDVAMECQDLSDPTPLVYFESTIQLVTG